ncbi:MAG: DUF6883 domain-containing protein [Bryobacteraceae bacterium]
MWRRPCNIAVSTAGIGAEERLVTRVPNPEKSFVDLAKLRDYCLDPGHRDGKHKARVFAAALGLKARDAEWLRTKLREAASGPARLTRETRFGIHYVIDFRLKAALGEANLRSVWIVRNGEDFARLVTCFVLMEK